MHIRIKKDNAKLMVYSILVLCISYFTYFRNYWYPPTLYWDENYHIAAAYKYLNHVMFLESHPPLGKLLIALGEYILHPNKNINMEYALTTDHIDQVPANFSFVGVRLFPSLLAALSALLLFFIFYKISHHVYLSFLFTSLYLFDNAIIIHGRGAMLESSLIFFTLLSLLYFLVLQNRKKILYRQYVLLGTFIGLTVSAKPEGVLLMLLFFPLVYYEHHPKPNLRTILSILYKGIAFLSGAIFIFCSSSRSILSFGRPVLNFVITKC